MDTTKKNNLNNINTSADLPLSAPADQFKKKFDELMLNNNLKDSKFSFPDFSKEDTAMEIKILNLK